MDLGAATALGFQTEMVHIIISCRNVRCAVRSLVTCVLCVVCVCVCVSPDANSQIRKYIRNQKFITVVFTFQIVTRFVWIILVGGNGGSDCGRVLCAFFCFFAGLLPLLPWITLAGHLTKMCSLVLWTSADTTRRKPDLPHYIIGKTNQTMI